MRQRAHLAEREVLEQRALGDECLDLPGKLGGVAEVLEVRELLRALWHGLDRLCQSLGLAPALHRLRERGQQFCRIVPAEARIGDALAEDERSAVLELLASLDE